MPKTVLIDLDDTLLDFKKAEKNALHHTLLQLGINPTAEITELYSAINASRWELLELGKLTRGQVLVSRFELLFEALGTQQSAEDVQRIYEKRLSRGHWFMPGAEALLETLSPLYDLYIVSNGTASVQDGRIADAGIAKYFRDIFISQRMGFNKPRHEFFDACAQRIPGYDPESTVIVGDSLTSDILGGRNAGITTIWFNPRGKVCRGDIVPDFEISSLSELPALLETLK